MTEDAVLDGDVFAARNLNGMLVVAVEHHRIFKGDVFRAAENEGVKNKNLFSLVASRGII